MLTDDQRNMRRETLGSSEIAAIVGEDDFKTPLDVWLEKRGEAEPVSPEHTDIGDALEEPIARLATRRLGIDAFDKGDTFRHGRIPWMTATPDFFVTPELGSRRVLEVKNVGHRMAHLWSEGVRYCVQLQTQWQLEVCEVEQAYVAALIGGRDLPIFPLDRDRALAADLMSIAADWWHRHIVLGLTPDPDGSEKYTDYLRTRYARGTGDVLKADADVERLMVEWRAAAEQRKAWAEAEETARQAVIARVGAAAKVTADCGTLTRVEVAASRVAYDRKASWHFLPKWRES